MMYHVTEASPLQKGLKRKIPNGYTELKSKYHFDKVYDETILRENYALQENTVKLINTLPKIDLNYRKFKLPKKTGGYREIYNPSDELKQVLNLIKKLFEDMKIPPSDDAFAFIKGRSTFMCRDAHRANGSKWFLNIDVEDFFGSCIPDLVIQGLSDLYPIYFYDDVRKKQLMDLIRAYCFLNNGLPQGSPVSPLLSNMVFIRYDYEIKRFLKQNSKSINEGKPFIYTRYADDIEISSIKKFKHQQVIDSVKRIITPLNLKDKKTKFGNNNIVGVWGLGILYNNSNDFSLGKKNIYDMEQDILNMVTCHVEGNRYDILSAQRSLGNINYFRNINEEQVERILSKFKRRYGFDTMRFLKESLK